MTKAEALRSAASTAQPAITAMNAAVEGFEQAYPGRNVDHAVCGLAQVVILEDDDNPGEGDAPRGGFPSPALLFLLRGRAYRRD